MAVNRVLIVEDDVEVRGALVEAIRTEEFEVDTAKNGAEALAKLKEQEPPSLILLDLMMPIMNGWEFMTACQKDPRLAKIPVVVLSAIANKDTAYGATDFLKKPVSLDALIEKLDKLCRSQSTAQGPKRTLH